jgi:hypothetical protein
MAEFINTVDVLGDTAVMDSLIERTITEFKDDKVTVLGNGALAMCKELKTVSIPNVTMIQSDAIRGGDSLETVYAPNMVTVGSGGLQDNIALQSICLPKATSILANALRQCYALEYVELPEVQEFGGYVFESDLALKAVVIRQVNTVPSITTTTFHYMYGSGISKGTGYVYVPSALVDRYKSATNWSVYAAQIRALEDYTVDGTITGELDKTKI